MNKLFFAILFSCLVFSMSAVASVYVWQDEKYDFTFAFPDSWVMQTGAGSTTRVEVSGPVDEDLASCNIAADEDGRLKIYPKHLMTTAVEELLDLKFWQGEVARYNDAAIDEFFSPSSIGGRGDATAVNFSFETKQKDKMYGTMVASIHADKKYIVRCSSRLERFERYAKLFANIMHSVQLEQKYYPFEAGYYRNFLVDDTIKVLNDKPGIRGTVFEGERLFNFFD